MARRRSSLFGVFKGSRGKVSRLASLWAGEACFDRGVMRPGRDIVPVHRAIAYSRLAEKVIASNPGLIKAFLSAREKIRVGAEKSVKIGSIELTDLRKVSPGCVANGFYKLSVGGRHFFVKESLREFPKDQFDALLDAPLAQAIAAKKAAAVIKRLSAFKDAFVVARPHFVFQGTDRMFVATEFYEGKTFDKYFPADQNGLCAEEFNRSTVFRDNFFKVYRLKDILNRNGIFDASNKNILWCPSLQKFVLLDLRSE